MITASFAVEVPDETWMATVSQSFPGTRFRLLTGIQVGDHAVELGEIVGGDVAGATAAFRDHPDIRDCEPLYGDDERSLAKYRTAELSMYEFLREAAAPPEFPVVVRDGRAEFDLTAPREQLQGLFAALDERDRAYEVHSVVSSPDPEQLLTDRQRELLGTALRLGYFAVPRECTLADVADAVGVDTSTASGVVRRGQARLAEWFLTGATDSGAAGL